MTTSRYFLQIKPFSVHILVQFFWTGHSMIILHCVHYQNIREAYLPQYMAQNRYISEILDEEDTILLSILDPLSSKLPDTVIKNWVSAKQIYKLSREFCYNIHRKRTKLYNDAEKLSWRLLYFYKRRVKLLVVERPLFNFANVLLNK